MEELLNVSSAPHVKDKATTSDIMFDVVMALMPASVFGVYNFGIKALILIIVCIATCVAAEAAYEYLMHKKITIGDYSAVVTGLLLALNLPYTLNVGMAIIGSLFAIIVVKQLFGGLGQNFMNPALGARCFLLVSFTGPMTTFMYDGVTTATPLMQMRDIDILRNFTFDDIFTMFKGFTAGTIGETSTAALLVGGIYLIAKRVIDFRIPLAYILTFVVFILIFGGYGLDPIYILGQLCGGGLMLGAFFMATDYVTSPVTKKGRIVFGIILGILTGIFRLYGKSAEGVSYAIIFSNLLVPLIERFTAPKPFGYVKKAKAKEGR